MPATPAAFRRQRRYAATLILADAFAAAPLFAMPFRCRLAASEAAASCRCAPGAFDASYQPFACRRLLYAVFCLHSFSPCLRHAILLYFAYADTPPPIFAAAAAFSLRRRHYYAFAFHFRCFRCRHFRHYARLRYWLIIAAFARRFAMCFITPC